MSLRALRMIQAAGCLDPYIGESPTLNLTAFGKSLGFMFLALIGGAGKNGGIPV